MRDRLKEIRNIISKATAINRNKSLSENFGWSDQYAKDAQFLLTALEEAQKENKLQEIRDIADFSKRTVSNDHLLLHIQHLLNELREAEDRERVLREALEATKEFLPIKSSLPKTPTRIGEVVNMVEEALGQEVTP